MALADARYRGRFAPSPTGPLHFGSLVAAVASYADALAHQGQWLLRMEDLDTPRCRPGAAEAILRLLEAYGFEWDGPVVYQSSRGEAYEEAFRRLPVYGCACTRRQLDGHVVYPGTCRGGVPPGAAPRAFRLSTPDIVIGFTDRLRGPWEERLAATTGDFVLRRADGLWAYQLAVVVDDAWQGVTDVVRGDDLLDNTPRQILLQRLLGYATPRYAHVPVVRDAAGEKLSKQTLAPPVPIEEPGRHLTRALRYLGQPVPAELEPAPPRELWDWARRYFRMGRTSSP